MANKMPRLRFGGRTPTGISRLMVLIVGVALALVLVVMMQSPPRPADAASSPDSGSISIPSQGKATPYPATVNVSGLSGTITDLNVSLKGVSHTFPDDIEALLVGPGGQKVILMANVGGGGDLNGVDLTFDDEAAGGLPDSAQIRAGTYKPTGIGSISIPTPAPAGPYGTSLTAFDGADPNGTYSLYVVDDSANDSGQISGGFSVDITTGSGPPPTDTVAPTVSGVAPADGTTDVAATANVEATFSEAMDPTTISGSTFTLLKQGTTTPVAAAVSYDSANNKAKLDPNANLDPSATYTATLKGGAGGVKDLAGNPLAADKSWSFSTAVASPPGSGSISIPSQGKATPYPATVNVSGLSGTITDLNVSLKGVSHTFPDDIEALLVGPGGQKVILMANVGGGGDLNGVDLTFDDEAAGGLPDSAQIRAGTYKPTRGTGSISIPTPAPAGPYGTSLTAFDGADPNGTYSLYVVDDAKNDLGQISGGFSVDITTGSGPPPTDTVACTITGTANADGTTDVAATANVEATFSEAMDP